MADNILQQIQVLQFDRREEAESLLLSFIQETFPVDVEKVQLRPQAISLNSFNGFLTLTDGKRLFFKTHTEQDNVISEYYNAKMLSDAGYPVIQPIHSSTRAGQHLLIYEVITDPSVFDLAWMIENDHDEKQLSALTQAQNESDDHLLQLYMANLDQQKAQDAAQSPVHQLFIHRLIGGRMERFYTDNIQLPHGHFAMPQVKNVQWRINDQEYKDTLQDIITRSIQLLNPIQAGPSIIGHGDAHNGNVFFHANPPALTYFDPAFAGRHHPLIDLTKPLFHNVFAMWMYFPQIKKNLTTISIKRQSDTWLIKHDYHLPELRHMFLRSKVERTLIPILQELKQRKWLRDDWREYLKAALFCCPFLTLNLADSERFPPEISLLGLSMAVEMGAESSGKKSLIDQTLDEVESVL